MFGESQNVLGVFYYLLAFGFSIFLGVAFQKHHKFDDLHKEECESDHESEGEEEEEEEHHQEVKKEGEPHLHYHQMDDHDGPSINRRATILCDDAHTDHHDDHFTRVHDDDGHDHRRSRGNAVVMKNTIN